MEYPIGISSWYSGMLYASQVLEVARNGISCIFSLISLNMRPNKPLRHTYYPKSVPNPVTSIISLPQNDTILVPAKILFLIFFHIRFVMEIIYIKMHWCSRLLSSSVSLSWLPSRVLVLICNLHEVSYKIWKVKSFPGAEGGGGDTFHP